MELKISEYNETSIAQNISSRIDKIFNVQTTFEIEKDSNGYLISIIMVNHPEVFDAPKFDKLINKIRSFIIVKCSGLDIQYKSLEKA